MKIIQSEKKRKKVKKREASLRDLVYTITRTMLLIMGVTEGEKSKNLKVYFMK